MEPLKRSSKQGRSVALLACLLSAAAGVAPGAAQAATINVTTTSDELLSAPDNGNCVLREALAAAETNAAVDGCTAGDAFPVRDTVALGPGTYQVTGASGEDANVAGDLDVAANASTPGPGTLLIDGTAAGVTIDALAGNGQDDRVIDLRSGNLEISDLTITGGRSFAPGGGIRVVAGNLTLTNVTVTDNQASTTAGGGIWATPSVSTSSIDIAGSRITQNLAKHTGGGISTGENAFLDVTDSVISGNQVVNDSDGSNTLGGGISAVQLGMIVDSTISANTVSVVSPGGVATPAGGGIALANTGTDRSVVLNSTITGNQAIDARADEMLSPAGGGVYSSLFGELFVVNSTVAGNSVSGDAPGGSVSWGGGGLFNTSSSVTAIVSSTVAANESPRGDALSRFGGAGFALQNSIVDDQDGVVTDTCATNAVGPATAGHNVVMGTTCVDGVADPTDLAGTNPQLGALGSFGGPTQTILPANSSPAVDLVPAADCDDGESSPSPLTEDQRHLLRPFDFAGDSTADCDAGAVERRPGDIVGPAPPSGSPSAPSNVITFGKLNGKKLTLTVPGPGTVEVRDASTAARAVESAAKKKLKRSTATAAAAGIVKVTLKLTKSAKQTLKQKGKVRVKAAITFTPTGGIAKTTTKKLKVKSR